jgi:RNA polymerase sigma factor (sigma-70 family)
VPSMDEPFDVLLDSDDGAPSDAELITAVRAGDEHAFGLLWRRHEAAALRLARQITNPSNAEDLVSESFARLLRILRQGGGPDGAFRPYLFSTLRRLNIDNARSYGQRISLTDDDSDLESEPASSAADVAAVNAEHSAVWRAWASLPESSRTLLWHLVVEEETPAQIAPLIGTSANGVSSRAVRARERLRQAFLQQHVADTVDEGCRWTRGRMGEYVRDALSARDRAAVQAHLDDCDTCPGVLFEIADVNQTLRLVIAPIILGGVSLAAYAGVGGIGSATTPAHPAGGWTGLSTARRVLVGAGGIGLALAIAAGATLGLRHSSSTRADATPLSRGVTQLSSPSTAASSAPTPSTPAAVVPPPITRVTTEAKAKLTPAPIPKATPTTAAPVIPVVPTTSTPTPPAPTSPAPTSPAPTPPAQTTISGQPHFIQFGMQADPASPGSVDVSAPTAWTITGVHITSPSTGWTCSNTAATVHCDIAAPDAATEYDYTIDLTGPADDHSSTLTITYANGAFSQTITPLVNP